MLSETLAHAQQVPTTLYCCPAHDERVLPRSARLCIRPLAMMQWIGSKRRVAPKRKIFAACTPRVLLRACDIAFVSDSEVPASGSSSDDDINDAPQPRVVPPSKKLRPLAVKPKTVRVPRRGQNAPRPDSATAPAAVGRSDGDSGIATSSKYACGTRCTQPRSLGTDTNNSFTALSAQLGWPSSSKLGRNPNERAQVACMLPTLGASRYPSTPGARQHSCL
jgi:hypothetical protein